MTSFKVLIVLVGVFISAHFLASCGDDSNGRTITDTKEYNLTIASNTVLGVLPSSGNNILTEVYVAKKEDDGAWHAQPDINGLEYESGYEYRIKVRKTSYLDYNMGDPAWTEYKMIELISKEKRISENVPMNFIPDWYKPQNALGIKYAIDADDKELIETDLKTNTIIPWNTKMIITRNHYAMWNNDNKMLDCGNSQIVPKDYNNFPDSYKILPPESRFRILSSGEILLESTMYIDSAKSYDVFLAQIGAGSPDGGEIYFLLYQDFTEYYKNRFPDAAVKSVVVSQICKINQTPYQ